jgi:glycosyltransferase involved in cell wall biosynthesis
MPTHNRGPGLATSVMSVLDQTLDDFELIVVDDASSPRAVEALPLLEEDPRIEYLYLDRNVGPAAARNHGIARAQGEFVAFLDDDDEFFPDKLAQVARAVGTSEADIFYHQMRIRLTREGYDYLNAPDPGPVTLRRLLIKNLLGGPSMVVARTTVLRSISGFNEQLPALEDYELWIRLASRGYRFEYLGEELSSYRRDTGRRSRTVNFEREMQARASLYELYSAAYRELSPDELREHRQKVAMFRGYRALVAYDGRRASRWFLQAFAARPRLSAAGMGLLAAAAIAFLSPAMVLRLQGRLKHRSAFRSLYVPNRSTRGS